MRSKFLVLSLLTVWGAFAEEVKEESQTNETSCCSTCCCSPCCCEPCVPKPPKCIDIEAYTPPFYDLQCDFGFFIDGEFLYWYARETNLPYAAQFEVKPDNRFDPDENIGTAFLSKIANLESEWDPGFRVGLGWNSSCDGWDFYLNWTYFYNKSSDQIASNFAGFFPTIGETGLYNPWWNGSQAFVQPAIFDEIKASWKIHFNQIDFEVGRKYWLSPCFTMRPYAGLRGAWTKTDFEVDASMGPKVVEGTTRLILSSNCLDDRLWGVGLLAGLQPNFYFTKCFILYANLGAALIWGEFEGKPSESYFRGESGTINITDLNQINSYRNDFFQMSPIIDLALGLRWEETWCCYRYRTALDLGWEHHVWFDHGYRIQATNFLSEGSPDALHFAPSFYNVVSDLNYGGLVIRLRVDF